MCTEGARCTRKICFFAHHPSQLREGSDEGNGGGARAPRPRPRPPSRPMEEESIASVMDASGVSYDEIVHMSVGQMLQMVAKKDRAPGQWGTAVGSGVISRSSSSASNGSASSDGTAASKTRQQYDEQLMAAINAAFRAAEAPTMDDPIAGRVERMVDDLVSNVF